MGCHKDRCRCTRHITCLEYRSVGNACIHARMHVTQGRTHARTHSRTIGRLYGECSQRRARGRKPVGPHLSLNGEGVYIFVFPFLVLVSFTLCGCCYALFPVLSLNHFLYLLCHLLCHWSSPPSPPSLPFVVCFE